MTSIIAEIMSIMGISQVPTTVQEYLWDLVILFVGLYIIKYIMVFVSAVFSAVMKL